MEEKETDKMLKARDKSQPIGEFLDWLLNEKHYRIAEYQKLDDYINEQLVPIHINIEEILAEFFGIDLKKAEKEKRELLEQIRSDRNG